MYLVHSPIKTKKWRAMFSDGTHTDFGSKGMDDYTKPPHDKAQRARYLTRHKKNENWNNPRSAGALSRYLLWGEHSSLDANLRDFNMRFSGKV